MLTPFTAPFHIIADLALLVVVADRIALTGIGVPLRRAPVPAIAHKIARGAVHDAQRATVAARVKNRYVLLNFVESYIVS